MNSKQIVKIQRSTLTVVLLPLLLGTFGLSGCAGTTNPDAKTANHTDTALNQCKVVINDLEKYCGEEKYNRGKCEKAKSTAKKSCF